MVGINEVLYHFFATGKNTPSVPGPAWVLAFVNKSVPRCPGLVSA